LDEVKVMIGDFKGVGDAQTNGGKSGDVFFFY
jgi:hypothetical protein